VIEMLPDLSIDIPKSPIYIANFIGFGVADNYLPMTFLEQAFTSIPDDKNIQRIRLVAEVFRTIASVTNHKKLRELYHESKLDLTKFSKNGSNDLVKILEDEKLTGLYPDLTYLKTLESMIHEDKECDKILYYIEQSVPRDEKLDQDFCNAVFHMIFKHMCSASNQAAIMKNLCAVLKKLVSSKKLQFGILLHLQMIFQSAQTQKVNVEKLCHCLHEFGVISSQIYREWTQDHSKELLPQLLSKWVASLPPDQEEEEEEEDESSFPYEEDEREETFEEEEQEEEEEEEQY